MCFITLVLALFKNFVTELLKMRVAVFFSWMCCRWFYSILMWISHGDVLMKSSYFDRYERSHRSIRTLTPTDTNVHTDRCETTSLIMKTKKPFRLR